MRSAAAINPPARPSSGHWRDQGRAWRRHVRRHAPPPPEFPPAVLGRVYNVFHHLADLSLPYDLWTEDAELAAIAHLLGKHTEEEAARVFVDTVQAYNAFNARFEPVLRRFSVQEAHAKVQKVAGIRRRLATDVNDADVYAAALAARTG